MLLSEAKSDLRVRKPEEWQAEMDKIQQALQSTPETDPSYPEILTKRGLCLTTRYGGMILPDIQTALDDLEKARGLMAPEESLVVPILAGMALCFGNKSFHSGQLQDLDSAIAHLEKILKILPDGDPDLGEYIAMMSMHKSLRHRKAENMEDLETAIELDRRAITLASEDDEGLITILSTAAANLMARYSRLGDLKDIQLALKHFKSANNVTPDDHPAKLGHLQGLSAAHMTMLIRVGDLRDLESAIELDRQAITLAGKDHEGLFMILSMAGTNLVQRYSRLGDLEDVQLALNHFEAATDLTPDGHPAKVGHLHGLAGAHMTMFMQLGNLKDLHSAINHTQTALRLLPDGQPRVPFLDMLATNLGYRYERLGNLDDLELAMELAEKVQKLVPAESHFNAHSHYLMGTILIWRYRALHQENDLHGAIYNHQVALHLLPEGDPLRVQTRYSLGQLLGFRYESSHNPEDLESAFLHYRDALQLASFRVSDGWIAISRWLSLAQEHAPAKVLTVYKAMFSLLPATFKCYSSDQISADFRKQKQLMSLQLYTGTAENPNRLATERNQLLAEIRKRPDFEYFLLPQPYQILSKAAVNGPIIILNAHEQHCDCIILLNTQPDPLHVALPDVTLDKLQYHKRTLQRVLKICNVRSRDTDSSRLFGGPEGTFSISVEDSFNKILTWLWKVVVGPLYQVLEHNRISDGRVWWCPTGAFIGLPLHAAATSDKFICSYTATIGALLDARRLPVSESAKLGLVGVTYSGQGGLATLPGVQDEIDIVTKVAGTHLKQSLIGDKATVAAVTSQLQTCEWVHLACHGKQDTYDPPRSCLKLHEGDLELGAIMKMALDKAEFAFLAACQTAMGDAQLVNESFHLGGGLIAAGFRGSIGTLWSMKDSDGPGVAETVYKYLFREGTTPKATDAAKALQLAVRKMRDDGIPYQRWVPFIHMGI
ncbi:CHAT domain-containing protein [Mycena polygramma]|nr:CHAT domain-containing protein [Mycena polygramma]